MDPTMRAAPPTRSHTSMPTALVIGVSAGRVMSRNVSRTRSSPSRRRKGDCSSWTARASGRVSVEHLLSRDVLEREHEQILSGERRRVGTAGDQDERNRADHEGADADHPPVSPQAPGRLGNDLVGRACAAVLAVRNGGVKRIRRRWRGGGGPAG